MNFKVLWPDRISWIVGLGTTLALSSQSIPFWIVSALKAVGYDDQQASLMVTAELFAMGLTMIIISPVVHRLPFKPMVLCAVIVALASQVISMIADDGIVMTATRACSGVSFGLLFSMATAAGSSAQQPEKTYAAAGGLLLIIGTLLNPLIGSLFATYGRMGVFVGLCIYCLINAVPLLLIPAGPLLHTKLESTEIVETSAVPLTGALGTFSLMFLMAVSMNGVFTFLGQIAERAGLQSAALGAGLALVSLLSALGGVLANRLGTRFGRSAPLIAGFLVLGLDLYALTVTSSPIAFWIFATVAVGCYWFIWPYIFGLAVMIDAKGRVASATGSAKIIAGGLGSAIAGYVVLHHGIVAYGQTAFATCILATVLVPIVVRAANRRSSPTHSVA